MNLDSRSKLFDSYWIFSEQRHRAYMSRISGQPQPWSTDDIITRYRFTNVYRASDRVSQYLIKHVQYAHEATDDPVDVIFRTLLFKIFNNISTWETLSRELGIINYARFDFEKADQILSRKIDSGATIYSAAYIMPSPPFGAMRKHSNHLRLIKEMMESLIPDMYLIDAEQELRDLQWFKFSNHGNQYENVTGTDCQFSYDTAFAKPWTSAFKPIQYSRKIKGKQTFIPNVRILAFQGANEMPIPLNVPLGYKAPEME